MTEQPSSKLPKDIDTVKPEVIPPEPKAPAIFQELSYLEQIKNKNLPPDALTALLLNTHATKCRLDEKLADVEQELRDEKQYSAELNERCARLEERIDPTIIAGLIFTLVGTTCLAIWNVFAPEWSKYLVMGAGIASMLGNVIIFVIALMRNRKREQR